MDLRDVAVQLSTQRLRELMLWHGKDEGNLPPAATLENLSRDTIAALTELQQARSQMNELRSALSQLFWSCDSSEIRVALLSALGAPPEEGLPAEASPVTGWQDSPSGLPPHALSSRAQVEPSHRATG